jgi:hypothetical protein
MNPHTSWYPADDPADTEYDFQKQGYPTSAPAPAPPEERSMSMPTLPFRFVAFGDGAPYPVHESNHTMEPAKPFMVDMITGDQWHRGGSLRQPVAEDFLRTQHPLPAPPVEEHDSDQEMEIIEPDSYLTHASGVEAQEANEAQQAGPDRHSTIGTSQPLTMSKPDAGPQRSESELDTPSRTSNIPDHEHEPEVVDTPPRIPTMGDDMFSPVLGGLQRLPSVPVRKESKMGRLKRFFSFRKKRQYGRAGH